MRWRRRQKPSATCAGSKSLRRAARSKAEKFRECDEKTPERRREINAEAFHHCAELRPCVRAAEHFRRALNHEQNAEPDAQKQQPAFAIFGERCEKHARI